MLLMLLTTLALAIPTWPVPTTGVTLHLETLEAPAALSAVSPPLAVRHHASPSTPSPYKVSGEQLMRRGRITTYVGLGTTLASIPITVALMNSYRGMGVLLGFFQGSLVAATGLTLTTAGIITSAVGRGRQKRESGMARVRCRPVPMGLVGTF